MNLSDLSLAVVERVTTSQGSVGCDMPRRGTDAMAFCADGAVKCETYRGGLVHHYCARCWTLRLVGDGK